MRTRIYTLLMFMACLALFTHCKSTKKLAYSPAGSWEYEVTGTPQGDVSGVMTLMKTTDGYSGTLEAMGGSIDLENIEIVDKQLKCTFDYQGYTLNVSGTFEGDSFDGELGLDYDTFPMKATRGQK